MVWRGGFSRAVPACKIENVEEEQWLKLSRKQLIESSRSMSVTSVETPPHQSLPSSFVIRATLSFGRDTSAGFVCAHQSIGCMREQE
jgi:hypothetical protein